MELQVPREDVAAVLQAVADERPDLRRRRQPAGAPVTAVVLSLAPHVEDRLLPQLLDEGHVVVARPAGAAEALATVERMDAEALIASASPRHCDGALLAAARARGLAVVLLAGGAADREHAAALGVRIRCRPTPRSASWWSGSSAASSRRRPSSGRIRRRGRPGGG